MNKAEKLYLDILKMILEKAKNMSDDEVYKFHEMLKDWFNKTI